MNQDSPNRLSVESLLRLKRMEKPSADFWTQFDSELRAKQLAAILPKRPWWTAVSRRIRALSRFQVPIGVAAAFAAVMAGVHQYRLVALSHAFLSPQTEVAGTRVPASAQIASAPVGERTTAVSYRESSASHGTSRLTGWVAGLGVMGSENAFETDTPSARSIAANLAVVQAAQPEMLRHLLGLSRAFDDRLVPARPVGEPLARIVPPSDERRSRMLAGVLEVSATPAKVGAPTGDRFVRHLSDDRLYDEAASRYRLGGDRPSLSIKF